MKIVRIASDETAELEVAEVDMFGEQLRSGLSRNQSEAKTRLASLKPISSEY